MAWHCKYVEVINYQLKHKSYINLCLRTVLNSRYSLKMIHAGCMNIVTVYFIRCLPLYANKWNQLYFQNFISSVFWSNCLKSYIWFMAIIHFHVKYILPFWKINEYYILRWRLLWILDRSEITKARLSFQSRQRCGPYLCWQENQVYRSIQRFQHSPPSLPNLPSQNRKLWQVSDGIWFSLVKTLLYFPLLHMYSCGNYIKFI